jgi:hypothetical protein
MLNNVTPRTDPSQSMVYQIRIKGHLGSEWKDWFGGLTVTLEENGDTLLTGPVADQAALHGLLRKVGNLGIPLVSVISVEPSTGKCVKLPTLN